MEIKLVVKGNKEIRDFFIQSNGSLLEKENQFYINTIAGKVITVDGYCEEEDVFTCIEYPDYAIPLNFISHKYEKVTYKDQWHEKTNLEIAYLIKCSSENIRKTTNSAIKKIRKIIEKDFNEYFAY
ncbi:hypothetical protein ACNSOL_11570 (plasmid) [Aliarcobacter lanthieri]|uniref:hypothetical protein n=1 Tax=Aliarcobacter lanthieri TaxID=1355374 RepID=UPI003AAC8E84